MIQVEIIEAEDEKKFTEDLNYFLERLSPRQLIDIKFNTLKELEVMKYIALVIYQVE